MAGKDPSQKEISLRYDGAANYPGHRHYLRRWRTILFGVALIASVATALIFTLHGKQTACSPGSISLNHTRLAGDCRACHLDTDAGTLQRALPAFGVGAAHATPTAGGGFSRMDAACLQCHAAEKLHLPQAASLLAPPASGAVTLVHASACASCHREHAGSERMALPGQTACTSCHDHDDQLRRARSTVQLAHPPPPAAAVSRNPGDGVIRFLAPVRAPEAIPAFADFAQGHPDFDYEGQRDPAAMRFSHERHLRGDLPWAKEPGGLLCMRCHQPGANGAFYQPIRYQTHCEPCHSLQFAPGFPNLRIPHGNPDLVRTFLVGREKVFEMALRGQGTTDPRQLQAGVQSAMQQLSMRQLNDLDALEKRVFFEGDPPTRSTDRMLMAGTRKFMTECNKCHFVTPGTGGAVPHVQPPGIADRWLQHGAFTHLPHQYMLCTDCHAAALKSESVGDILLPPKALCAQCHRASEAGASLAEARGDTRALVAAQFESGGVKASCTDCHRFHSPPNASEVLARLTAPSVP